MSAEQAMAQRVGASDVQELLEDVIEILDISLRDLTIQCAKMGCRCNRCWAYINLDGARDFLKDIEGGEVAHDLDDQDVQRYLEYAQDGIAQAFQRGALTSPLLRVHLRMAFTKIAALKR